MVFVDLIVRAPKSLKSSMVCAPVCQGEDSARVFAGASTLGTSLVRLDLQGLHDLRS
jgi:hypothetical protein